MMMGLRRVFGGSQCIRSGRRGACIHAARSMHPGAPQYAFMRRTGSQLEVSETPPGLGAAGPRVDEDWPESRSRPYGPFLGELCACRRIWSTLLRPSGLGHQCLRWLIGLNWELNLLRREFVWPPVHLGPDSSQRRPRSLLFAQLHTGLVVPRGIPFWSESEKVLSAPRLCGRFHISIG